MGKKILLADDSITIQKVIELTFSDEDFDVVTVGNGRLAIDKLHEVRPDVVLCDIIMPEKDGYEVCDYIKKDPTLAHIPVLLLTGAFEPFDQERAARVGCDGYLAKPFEPQTLITRVKALLAQSSGSKSAPAAPVEAAPAAFETIQEVDPPAPVASVHAFEPLAAPGDFEPLEAVPFEPLPPEVISSEPLVEPEPLTEYVPEAATARPTQTNVPRAIEPEGVVAFIPEEPISAPPAPAVMVPVPVTTPSFEPVFIPDDEAVAVEAEPEPEEFVAAARPVERVAHGETLPPGTAAWAGTTVEVPLEERAQASVEAAYGSEFGSGSETVLEDVTLEPDAAASEPEPTQALDEDLGPVDDQRSIFDAMGLDQEAGAKVQAELAETEAGTAETLAEDVEWDEDAAAPGSATDASAGEPAGAEILLDDDLSAPADMAAAVEAAAASVESGPEPEAESEIEPELEALATPPPAAPVVAAMPMPVARVESFEEVLQPAEPAAVSAAQPSRAAEVAVPVDMVAQIAQRVVGQISEKVIREIAWEIIPELAEALIKKEIERLKAELDQIR